MPALAKDPSKTIRFSAYYDAAASTKENDYGNFSAITTEDFYFSSSTRSLALGRLRREVRNNPYLAGLVNKYPEALGYSTLRSRTASKAYNDAKDQWWFRRRKKITTCGLSLRGLEKLIKRELPLAGEIFLIKVAGGRLQVIPSEYCGSGALSRSADGSEINGILYAADGTTPISYRFGKMSPTGLITYGTGTVGLVAAEHVIHIFDKDRVQMGRGLPWLLASLKTARDLYEITRSKTKQIKDANSISGFINKPGATAFLDGLTPPSGPEGVPVPEAATDAADRTTTGPIVVELRPGMFIALEPGETITTLMSNYNASDYKELIMLMLHAMSTPLGLPVELWFSGLGDVNYSGYKGLGVQWDGRRRDVLDFLVDTFYEPLHAWAVELAHVFGDLPPAPEPGADELIDWMFRRTPILDDEKSGKANKIKLESGETDLSTIWEENGYYAEEVFERRRQLWIKAQIAAGELAADGDHAAVKVPIDFLLRNELPGETTVPHIPDGTGITSATQAAESAAADAQDAADAAAASAQSAQRSATQLTA